MTHSEGYLGHLTLDLVEMEKTMCATQLVACILGLVALSLQAGCATTCGPPPAGFTPEEGGMWDENRVREQVGKVDTVCLQYKALAERAQEAKKTYELPRLGTGENLTFSMGTVALSDSERSTYAVLSTVDRALEHSAIARCQAAMLSYECVVFRDPNKDPRVAGLREAVDSVNKLEVLTRKAKAVSEAREQSAFDQAVKEFKDQLQQQAPPTSAPAATDPN